MTDGLVPREGVVFWTEPRGNGYQDTGLDGTPRYMVPGTCDDVGAVGKDFERYGKVEIPGNVYDKEMDPTKENESGGDGSVGGLNRNE